MEDIFLIRQLLAESRYVEAQKYSEELLNRKEHYDARGNLIALYLEALKNQSKNLPTHYLLELSQELINKDIDQAQKWLEELTLLEQKRHFIHFSICRMKIAEKKGLMAELYDLVSNLQVYLFEKNIPSVPKAVEEIVEKYFKNDFSLRLQRLAILFLENDLVKAEEITKELLISSLEKASSKGTAAKLNNIKKIYEQTAVGFLEIYKDLINLFTDGISEKKSYKRLAEIIIYFDDFRMQTVILHLLDNLKLKDLLDDYAKSVRKNKDYDFVYFDKYFRHLKKYFVALKEKEVPQQNESLKVDLTLEGHPRPDMVAAGISEDSVEGEEKLIHLIRNSYYSPLELNEIAISFLQSHMPKVALKAIDMALRSEQTTKEYLKSCYLKLTCLLLLGDYRSVLDLSLQALERAESKEDILSFLYTQAEAWIKMNHKEEAKKVLRKIVSIDSQYRFAKERLERLDEV